MKRRPSTVKPNESTSSNVPLAQGNSATLEVVDELLKEKADLHGDHTVKI